MPIYTLKPQTDLCLPVAAGGEAPATVWPLPPLIHDALHAALHRAFPQVQLWEQTHPFGRSGHYSGRKEKGERFGSLTIAGPFPCREESQHLDWFFPRPADVLCLDGAAPLEATRTLAGNVFSSQPATAIAGNGAVETRREIARLHLCRPLKDDPGHGNLPAPLQHVVAGPGSMDSQLMPAWWSKSAVEAYLRGEVPERAGLVAADQLYTWEREVRRPAKDGIDRDELPSRDLLCLAENVSLGLWASMPLAANGNPEGMDLLVTKENWPLLVGSSRRVCHLHQLGAQQTNNGTLVAARLEQFLPLSVASSENCVKWVLLTPAVYPMVEAAADGSIRQHPGGWLPNWVCPATGRVLLKQGQTDRHPGESRIDWRRRWQQLPDVDCRLVAARIPKPLILGGWSGRLRGEDPASIQEGPKATHLAVPPGAVFYFTGPDAPVLSELLSWHGSQRENISRVTHRRSALLGEKGLGLGVCGPWEYLDL
jgi:CRISPR-associated protein Cmr3